MTVPVVVLQIDSPDAFVEELKHRGIGEVRVCTWYRRSPYLIMEMKCRFTAYDPGSGVILRLDVTYYRGFYGTEEDKREAREAYEKVVEPVKEKISRVARILDGEYHNGEAKW